MRSLYPWPIFPPDLNPAAARSLSFQLILQEWLSSITVIDSLAKHSESSLDIISDELQKFLLFSMDNPFAKRAGTLDKLSYFSDELLNHSRIEIRATLDTLLNHMRDAVLSFRQRVAIWKRKAPLFSTISIDLYQLCQLLTLRLKEFFQALLPFFEEAKSDENILFYLIEHRDAFNQIFSTKKIEDLLSQLYPTGPAHLRAILCEGYTRRGFGEFHAKQEALIDSIEWTVDVWTTTPAYC